MYILTDASAECTDGVRLEGNRSCLRAFSSSSSLLLSSLKLGGKKVYAP